LNGQVKSESKVNILVVDDRADKLLAIETIIAPLQQNIVKARSGKEALLLGSVCLAVGVSCVAVAVALRRRSR